MDKNKIVDDYLKTAPIGQYGGVSATKIEWIKYNLVKFFKSQDAVYLDIGPGQGEVLLLWRQLGFKNIKSIDISTSVCEHIKNLGFDCELIESTERYFENNRNKFDCIMLNDVVEHIPKDQLDGFITAVYDGLKKGGRVIIKVPNAQSPHFSIGRYGDLTHVQSFTETSLTQLLKTAGFSKFSLLAEKQRTVDLTSAVSKYLIMPIYFYWIRKVRAATFHSSPKILTQAIIALAEKE